MNVGEVIAQAKTYLRRDTFFTPEEWRHLINTAQMEFTSLVDPLETDFDVHLTEGIYEYDLNVGYLYRLTEDATYAATVDGETSYTTVALKTRREMLRLVSGDLFSQSGSPSYVYPIGSFSVGVYPTPDADTDAQVLIVHGLYHPVEITSDTEDDHELEFPPIDHPAIVLSTVVQAERIDKDIVPSRDYYSQYMSLVAAARNRRANRLSGTSKMVTYGR